MKNIFWLIAFGVVIGCENRSGRLANDSLSAAEEEKFVNSIIRYTTKTPQKIREEDRFDPKYKAYYDTQAKLAKLEHYVKKDGYEYFLLSQPAPSLTDKRHATGGRLKFSPTGGVAEYEEMFRTWKMVPDTLARRGSFLFEKMIKGESLEPYYPQNAGGADYIEFPDARTVFDKTERKWKVKE